MMTASIMLMTRTTEGRLILNKLGRRRMKLCLEWWQQSNVNSQNVSIFVGCFFFCPIPTLLFLAPISLGPGEATHSELLGTKRVKQGFINVKVLISLPLLLGRQYAKSTFYHTYLPSYTWNFYAYSAVDNYTFNTSQTICKFAIITKSTLAWFFFTLNLKCHGHNRNRLLITIIMDIKWRKRFTSASCDLAMSTRVFAAGWMMSSVFSMVAPSFEITALPENEILASQQSITLQLKSMFSVSHVESQWSAHWPTPTPFHTHYVKAC